MQKINILNEEEIYSICRLMGSANTEVALEAGKFLSNSKFIRSDNNFFKDLVKFWLFLN